MDDAERDGIAGPATHRIAQSVFDRIAIHLPSAEIVGPMIAICSEVIVNPQPHVRAMAPLALGIAAEGCGEMLAQRVGAVLPAVINLFRDGDNGVRHCACFCVGQWIEHMESVLTQHHAAIIPEAFRLLDAVSPPHAPVPDVQRGALYVLEVCFYLPLHFKRILLTILTCPPHILTFKNNPSSRRRRTCSATLS